MALDTTSSSGWPNWTSASRVDCAVSLSGAYQYDDRTSENYGNDGDPLPQFIQDIENYTNSQNLKAQEDLSPVSLVTPPSEEHPFKPLFLINTQHDPTPYHQIVDVICALKTAGVAESDYKTMTLSRSNEHSFNYWESWDRQPCPGGGCKTVGEDVIAFLDTHLK